MNPKTRTAILAGVTFLSLCFFVIAVIHRNHRFARAARKGVARTAQANFAALPAPSLARPEPHEIAGDFPKEKQVWQSLTQGMGASRRVTTGTLSRPSFMPSDSAMPLDATTTTPTVRSRFPGAMTSETWHMAALSTATLAEDDPTSAAADGKRRGFPNLEGKVTDPAGFPLNGAEVYLCDRERHHYSMSVMNGLYDDRYLVHPDVGVYAQVMTTNPSGLFQFRTPAKLYTIVVRHASGIALRTEQDFSNHEAIVVPPWGRLEGTYHDGSNHPIARARLAFIFGDSEYCIYDFLSPPITSRRPTNVDCDAAVSYQTLTDDAGHFVIDPIQAGTVFGVGVTGFPTRRAITIKPGETTRIRINKAWRNAITVLSPTPQSTPAPR